jgi:transposase
VLRARIVLLAAGGAGNSEIARQLGTCEDTARKWRRRYREKGLEGLADAPRPGRPRVFPAAVVAEVKALACEMSAASGTPLARWTCPETGPEGRRRRHRARALVDGAPLAR